MTPNPTQNPLPPLDPIISDHLDYQMNEAVANLQRLITNAFNTEVQPLQQEIMDLQAQFRSNGLTQAGLTGYKANLPTPYDGSQQNGEGFIKACCLYLQLNMCKVYNSIAVYAAVVSLLIIILLYSKWLWWVVGAFAHRDWLK